MFWGCSIARDRAIASGGVASIKFGVRRKPEMDDLKSTGSADVTLDPKLLALLVCPRDRLPLSEQPTRLPCPQGRQRFDRRPRPGSETDGNGTKNPLLDSAIWEDKPGPPPGWLCSGEPTGLRFTSEGASALVLLLALAWSPRSSPGRPVAPRTRVSEHPLVMLRTKNVRVMSLV
jgi:hypothetical protein